ncbi:MAG: fibronectin type III domain-containing protein [Bacteriovoracaceae bacterium]|nr:fibronectin type III domain-containing protein [Bacteriovoracaceae bacterium]
MFIKSAVAIFVSIMFISCDGGKAKKVSDQRVEVQNSISPSVPQELSYKDLTATSVKITWSPSRDKKGIVAYRIYRDENLVGSSAKTSFLDEKLKPSTVYTYRISAVDTSSIESEKSMALRVKTHGDTDAKTNFGKPRTPAGESHFLGRVRVDSKSTYKYN